MDFSQEQQEVIDKAKNHAKSVKRQFAKSFTDKTVYKPDEDPVSVFMSGSPGAGKTEVSKQLIARYESEGNGNILRIDPDELRVEFEDYNGKNSFLFQGAVSLLVEKIHDLALKQKQSFILDGTLSKYEVACTGELEIVGERGVPICYLRRLNRLSCRFFEPLTCPLGVGCPICNIDK